MKNLRKVALILFTLTLALAFTACTVDQTHEHALSDDWASDAENHWHTCSLCDEQLDLAPHTPGTEKKTDGINDWFECTECSAKIQVSAHIHDIADVAFSKGDGQHWKVCNTCGMEVEKAAHASTSMEKDENGHLGVCDVCGETMENGAHISDNILHTDSENPSKHWNLCEVCGYKMNEADHAPASEWSNENNTHFHLCDCGAKLDKAECTPGTDLLFNEDYSMEWHECSVCSAKLNEAAHVHDVEDADYVSNGEKHWKVCPTCQQKVGEADHNYVKTSEENADTEEYSCVCGKTKEVKAFYSPAEAGTLAYLGIGENNVTVALPAGFSELTVTGVFKNGGDINLLAGTPQKGASSIVLNGVTEAFDPAADFGIYHLEIEAASDISDSHLIKFPVIIVTDYIESVEDLLALRSAAAVVTGYYALKGNIDATGKNTDGTAVSEWSGGFGGTLDGRGFTISGLTATQKGIFTRIAGATVKDIHFANTTLNAAPLFCRVVANTIFVRNVTVDIVAITPKAEFGVFVSKEIKYGQNPAEFTDITVNVANGLVLPSVLGDAVEKKADSCVLFDNFTVNATAVTAIGKWTDGNAVKETDGITLNVATPVSTFCAGENTTVVKLKGEWFALGANVNVVINGTEQSYTVSAEGELDIDLASFFPTAPAMGQYAAAVEVGGNKYAFTEIWYVTKVVKTADDIKALSNTVNNRITGYYVLNGDINCSWTTIQGGSTTQWNQNSGFGGTFDGRGYTINRFSVSGYGIFGCLGQATVKNVKFELVTLNANAALFARTMYNSTIENVSVKLNDYKTESGECGVLVSRQTGTSSILKNITVDANNLAIYNILGCQFDTATTVTNFNVINASSITYYGTSDSGGTTAIAKPTGMTTNVAALN